MAPTLVPPVISEEAPPPTATLPLPTSTAIPPTPPPTAEPSLAESAAPEVESQTGPGRRTSSTGRSTTGRSATATQTAAPVQEQRGPAPKPEAPKPPETHGGPARSRRPRSHHPRSRTATRDTGMVAATLAAMGTGRSANPASSPAEQSLRVGAQDLLSNGALQIHVLKICEPAVRHDERVV